MTRLWRINNAAPRINNVLNTYVECHHRDPPETLELRGSGIRLTRCPHALPMHENETFYGLHFWL